MTFSHDLSIEIPKRQSEYTFQNMSSNAVNDYGLKICTGKRSCPGALRRAQLGESAFRRVK